MLPPATAPPLSRPCTSEDTPLVKSISVRSVCDSAVGSRVASVKPEAADGPLKPPLEILVLMVPVKLTKVGSMIVVSEETLVFGAITLALTTSLPKPKSTTPLIRDPDSSVSVSAALESLIAVPPVPVMVPELVMLLPIPPIPKAVIPITPEIVPELTTAADVLAKMAA